MRLDPILRAQGYMRVERPPALWEADTEDARFLPLLGEIIAAALGSGSPLGELTLAASNVMVEQPEDDDCPMTPQPAEYVAVTVRGPCDLGPDDRWRPAEPCQDGLLSRLHARLDVAGARYAYVRRIPPEGSITVFFFRVGTAV